MKEPRSILITGASSGIGAALAASYAAPGVHLALTGRDAARLDGVAAQCRARGGTVSALCLDITDERALADWIESVDRERPLELVIANAGMTGGAAEGVESLGEVRRIMQVNFAGVCNTIHPAIALMSRRGAGQIALVSSIAAWRGLPYSPAYCASKAALTAYGEALRGRLRPLGIAVSIILPGFVDTKLSRHVDGPKPLLMTVEKAARIIRRGLARRKARIAFPRLLDLGMRLLPILPAWLVDPVLMSLRVRIRRYE
jgi:short-subunit dehydrogenase